MIHYVFLWSLIIILKKPLPHQWGGRSYAPLCWQWLHIWAASSLKVSTTSRKVQKEKALGHTWFVQYQGGAESRAYQVQALGGGLVLAPCHLALSLPNHSYNAHNLLVTWEGVWRSGYTCWSQRLILWVPFSSSIAYSLCFHRQNV